MQAMLDIGKATGLVDNGPMAACVTEDRKIKVLMHHRCEICCAHKSDSSE